MARATVLAFGIEEARHCARAFSALSAQGRRIGERDLQIAATAVAQAHDVLTFNVAEFKRVPGLRVLTTDSDGTLIDA